MTTGLNPQTGPIAEAYRRANRRQQAAARQRLGCDEGHILRLRPYRAAPWVLRTLSEALGVPEHELGAGRSE